MFQITHLGSDPELILRSNKDGNPVSAETLSYDDGSVVLFADNVLAEFNHKAVVPDLFVSTINEALDKVSLELSSFKGGCTYTLGECEALYPTKEVSSLAANEIGCEPFLSAYNLGVNVTPQPYKNNVRFAGGHLHIAYDKETLPPHLLVQYLDEYLLPLDKNYKSSVRSKFYGSKGSYREKSYGLEYRALSNWWLSNPQLILDRLSQITTLVNNKYHKEV